MTNQTQVERKSDREVVITRTINGPPELVFKAWTEPELFKQWWVPKSIPMTLVSCEMDVRTGGGYRLVFAMGEQKAEFFGKYIEVTPHSRLVWTNDEGGEDAIAVTTVTFEEREGKTLLTLHELYPSKEALDEEIAQGAIAGIPEQWDQLEEFIATLQ
ncbi:MAG: SRPBCC family protein [Polyangiaceae bacterium]|nr:SRPBCC family protein [Myxococcales bacterium]MCB9586162.1 SRPBCC family protein [Polyangiaceae bacterium]MCB9606839.1 SRPBCC family protein [Polyangiaceae bacterium]